jgi:hypothetical protein
MWMDAYLQEIWIREHMTEAQRRAARDHLLSRAKPHPSRAQVRTTLRRNARAALIPRIALRIVRMAFP